MNLGVSVEKLDLVFLSAAPWWRQCCDLGYHSSLSRALRTYLSAELSVEASRRAGLEVLDGAVEGLDPARDRQRLLGLYPTAFCPPQRFGFQSHMGDTVSAATGEQHFSAEKKWNFLERRKKMKSIVFFFFKINFILRLVAVLLADNWLPSTSCQVTQIVSQQQVQAELTLRLTQLQTRLASLKIENEEVSHAPPPSFHPQPVLVL